MKLITFRHQGQVRTGAVAQDGIYDLTDMIDTMPPSAEAKAHAGHTGQPLAAQGMLRLLQAGPAAIRNLGRQVGNSLTASPLIALQAVELLAPVPRPGKVIAIGRNYRDHADESGMAPPEKPRIIGKFPSSITGPNTAIPRTDYISKLDFEAELAVVIGRHARNVNPCEALAFVAGYSILNDLSAREFQFDIQPAQTTFAKSMDGFTPMGPCMVTADEIDDPQTLSISSWVNGVLMQQGNTSKMLFSVSELIAYISRTITLEPGDVIATGTPAGSGAFRTPPRYLQPGDHVRIDISGIGILEHSIC
jgi:2-keto-4-pentenoate hydratase/2-oxohepta-3-ene-1,7-dioic acid hydratase in catechol pathway